MDQSDWVLLALAGYAAVTLLVRLMTNRQGQLLDQLRRQAEQESKKRRSGEPDQQASSPRRAA